MIFGLQVKLRLSGLQGASPAGFWVFARACPMQMCFAAVLRIESCTSSTTRTPTSLSLQVNFLASALVPSKKNLQEKGL